MSSGPHTLVVLEGIDGAGKGIVREALLDVARAQGVPVVSVGRHSWLDVDATRVLVSWRNGQSAPGRHVHNAYERDHDLLLERIVVPALEVCHVLADRSIISTAVYGAVLHGVDFEDTLARFARLHALPDLIVYVRASAAVATSRLSRRARNSQPWESEQTLADLDAAFDAVLAAAPARGWSVVTFDNTASPPPATIRAFAADIVARLQTD